MKCFTHPLWGLLLVIAIALTSCQKQTNPDPMSTSEATLKICHNTGYSYDVIEISEDAWPGHQDHGDMLYEEFPRIGIYKWAINFGEDSTHLHTMYITAVTQTDFSGYGIDHSDEREWTIDDAVIFDDESWEFTMDYNSSNDYLECSGSYVCGEGIVGTFGGEGETFDGYYSGSWSDDNGTEEVDWP